MKKNIKEFCDRYNLTEAQFKGIEKVDGDLYLRSLTAIPEGFNPTVGGNLYLERLVAIPEGFNPTVGGNLDLRSLTAIPEGFNPTVGGYLYLRSLTAIPEGFNPTVGGDLYLGSVTSIPEGFNPIVGGYLYLGSVTSIPEGFNPTVGGDLYLERLVAIPEGFNPTVGGDLYLQSLTAITEGFKDLKSWRESRIKKPVGKIDTPKNKLLFWQGGKFVKADGIFTEVISKKGNAYRVKKLHSQKEFYLVTDGTTHAHGGSLQKAKEDFRFKIMAEKLKSEPIQKDTLFTVNYYRLVTGACNMGCRHFMEQNNIPFEIVGNKAVEKNPIKAVDLLKLLENNNAYGLDKIKQLIAF